MKKRVAVRVEQGGSNWPPADAAGCVAWFQKQLESIPPEFRSEAKFAIQSGGVYEDSPCARVEISYYRPETDAEMCEREIKERRLLDLQKEKDLQKLAELKAKYGV